MTKYEFIIKGLYSGITADEAAAELDRIREKHGTLNPSLVVMESAREDSVLHNVFCWDNEKAAMLYRARQAQDLIRNIRVTITNENVECSVRAFVNVRPAPGVYRSYVPTQEAILNDTSYKDLLEQAKGDMDSFVTKYSQLSELNQVKAEMLKALTQ